jgi:hypothetical protein
LTGIDKKPKNLITLIGILDIKCISGATQNVRIISIFEISGPQTGASGNATGGLIETELWDPLQVTDSGC